METKKAFAVLLIGLAIFGCCGKSLFECPSTCDDNNPCTTDHCGSDTFYNCDYKELDGDTTGCSGGASQCATKTCQAGKCVQKLTPECSVSVACDEVEMIYPAEVHYFSINDMSFYQCRIRNFGEDYVTVQLNSELVGYSDLFSTTVMLAPEEETDVNVSLTFYDKFYTNSEVTSTHLNTDVYVGGKVVQTDSNTVTVQKSSVLRWAKEADWYIAAMWVTPNDKCVSELITQAKKKTRSGAFTHSASSTQDDETFVDEICAVFDTLKEQKITYVNSPLVSLSDEYFASQDIRFPYESLTTKSMNCIDGTVLYASIFEKLGYEPIIVLVPGHAFVMVSDNANTTYAIETTQTGGPTECRDAIHYAYDEYWAYYNQNQTYQFSIRRARDVGYVPMPISQAHECSIREVQASCYDPHYGTVAAGLCTSDKGYLCQDGAFVDGAKVCRVATSCFDDRNYVVVPTKHCTYDRKYYCEDGVWYNGRNVC